MMNARNALTRLYPRMAALALLALLASPLAVAQFNPPQKISPGPSTPQLDASYKTEAWLVYSYTIDKQGNVTDIEIHSSNGVPEVEQAVLQQLNGLQFRPATRNGEPVEVPVGPVVYTWILDIPREMGENFATMYETAWEHFRAEDYDQAFDLAARLKEASGRNAFEEVKFQILAASIANRWEDPAAELQHLKRLVEFQDLADRNLFEHPYVEPGHYALILERIQSIQLDNKMLADAQATLNKIRVRGGDEEVTARATQSQKQAQARLESMPDVATSAELTPLYRGGPGSWEMRLSRNRFTVRDVRGDIDWLYLACLGSEKRLRFPSLRAWEVPAGWRECKVEVSGRAGTRFKLHQLAPGAGEPG